MNEAIITSGSSGEHRMISPNWGWCLKIGVVIALVDLVVLALSQGHPPESAQLALLDTLDQIANIMLFSLVGYRTGRETGRATAAAEAGVFASLVPAAAAALYQVVQPALFAAPIETTVPVLNRVVGAIAFNVVLGGISAWVSGLLAARNLGSRS